MVVVVLTEAEYCHVDADDYALSVFAVSLVSGCAGRIGDGFGWGGARTL